MSHKVAVVMPVVGKPYICNDIEINLDYLKKMVGGYVEVVASDNVWVHPMFCVEEEWGEANRLLQTTNKKKFKVYVNENGGNECTPNVALFHKTKDLDYLHGKEMTIENYNNCPIIPRPYFGNVIVVIQEKYLEGYNFLEEEEEEEEEE